MTAQKLPELPEPVAFTTQIKEGRVLFEPRISLNTRGMVGIFTSAEVLAAFRAGMEQAAQMCEAQEGDAVTRAVAKGCAAAIRRAAEEGQKP